MAKGSQASLLVVDLVSDDENRKFASAGRMASAMIEITQEQGGCLPQDLNAIGFTLAEVAEHWHMAKAMADVELRIMEGRSMPDFRMEKRHG